MKHFSLLFITLFFSVFGNAQTLDFNAPLPMDASIKKGVLPNGMTYYIHSTDVTKDVASYYIIQNVGSVLENDDQQGLAHFLEHMAFNGTETFPGKSLLNKLQEHGLAFGMDINAYTSFDETVYNINNVPTTTELSGIGLQALHDWSNYLLLTDEEIDAERGVIKEEWRTRQNGRMRIFQQTIGTMFGHSKYAERLPIGLMSIVDNFDYKVLRDFYQDWYRTDLQAIAIIGDFDVDDMEAKVKEKFSSIPAVKNPPKRFVVTIEDNEDVDYAIGMDKEVAREGVSFSIRHDKSLKDKTVGDLYESLLNSMITSILNERFQAIAREPEAPVRYISARYDGQVRKYNSFSLQVGPKPNMQRTAFSLAMNELNRAVKFGFTTAEIERTKIGFSTYFENEIAKLNDRPHGSIVKAIQDNYLENDNLTDLTKEYKLVQQIFATLTKDDLLKKLQALYTKKNRSVIVTGVEGKDNLTKAQALKIINAAENNAELKPYEEEKAVASLMEGIELTPGTIISEIKNETIGFTEFTLSNGIVVSYKFVDKDKNSVKLNAVSEGGRSLLEVADLPSANYVSTVTKSSGLGDFSATDLSKALAGKTASTDASIGSINESISGTSSTKDVETMLQMVYLRFTKPRFEKTAYDVFMQNMDSRLLMMGQDLGAKMQDSITIALYGFNHPTKRLMNKAYLNEISFDKIQTIYNDRFENPADFKFFIVGDVKKESLKPLLEKYIASLPTTKVKENWKDNSTEWLLTNTDKDVYLEMEDPKSSVNIAIKKEMPYNLKDQLLIKALGDILQLRYTETLREEEGGTYGARAWGALYKKPKSLAYLSVRFDCNPDLAEKLIGIVHAEMNKIKAGNISQKDLDKTLTNFLKVRTDSKNKNSHDLNVIKTYVLDGYNMEAPENFENIVNAITKKDIQDIANRILTDYKSYEIVFKPQLN